MFVLLTTIVNSIVVDDSQQPRVNLEFALGGRTSISQPVEEAISQPHGIALLQCRDCSQFNRGSCLTIRTWPGMLLLKLKRLLPVGYEASPLHNIECITKLLLVYARRLR